MSGSLGRLFGVSETSSSISKPLEPFFHFGSSPSFLGSSSMVSFEDVCGGEKRSGMPFFYTYDQEENGDGDFDEYLHQPEKKRRLTIEQVRFLEKSFETENKLEPERKVQLANEIGLQPRQVAIWFQNRRARWKTKQLEKDFDTLQDSYNSLKSDYESLVKEKEKLKVEVDHLTNVLQLKEQDQKTNSELSNLFTQPKTIQRDLNIESTSESKDQHISTILGYNKQEDLSSANSNVIDSDSPHYVNVRHSFAEPGSDSSYAFEADHSDISQDDEDDLNKSLLPSSHAFLKIEDDHLADNSCHFNISEDAHASMFWPYWDINI